MTRAFVFCLGLATLVAALAPPADAQDSPPAAPADAMKVAVVDDAGKTHTGDFELLTARTLTLKGNEAEEIPRGRVLRLTTVHPATRLDSGPWVLLANGDRLGLKVRTIEEERLIGTWADFPERPEVSIPLEMVRGIVFAPPEPRDGQRRLLIDLRDRREESDLVVLAKGDRLTGEFQSLGAERLEIEGAVGKFQIPRPDLRALVFNASLISVPKGTRPYELLTLTDGSCVTVRKLTAGPPGALQAEPVFGGTIEFPWNAVTAIRFAGARSTFVSELPVAGYTFTPYLSAEWKLGIDRSPLGGPLRLRGTESPRGLGMHSRSVAEYRLDGKYARFLSQAGIDDETNGAGNVVFAVEVDGERLFTSEPQSGRSPALTIGPIDLTGKKSLSLIVDYGRDADIQDHADWLDPVLVREEK